MPGSSVRSADATRGLALVVTIVIVVFAAWGRLVNLGGTPFWTDELNHHYAAQSMAAGRGPVLPSGEQYTRGIVITQLIAWTQTRVVDAEAAARLPSALFGIVALVLMAVVGWVIGGPWVAVWATALLAIYPEAVYQSRTARFYTFQLSFGLVALFGLWKATCAPRVHGESLRHLVTQWGWLAVAGLGFATATHAQATTLSVLVATGAWLALAASNAVWRVGKTALRTDATVQLVVAGGVILLILTMLGVTRPLLTGLWEQSQSVASWTEAGDPRFYLWALAGHLPWIAALLPVMVIAALVRAPVSGLFLVCWFFVPFVLHSFVLPWKAERYFLLPLPALFLLTGLAATWVLGALRASMATVLQARGMPPILMSAFTAGMIGAVATWSIAMLPAFTTFRQRFTLAPPPYDWQSAAAVLTAGPGGDSLPIGSVDALMALHFVGRVDFGVQPGLLDFAVPATASQPQPRFAPSAGDVPRDFYTAVPVLPSADAIRTAYARFGAVIVLANPQFPRLMDASLRDVLLRDAEDLCRGNCDGVRPYLWRFAPVAIRPSPGGG
jgi:4-amino-4-deoxy-L-arabinose transferase-like glycosyltransferase